MPEGEPSHAEMIAADLEWLRGEYEYQQRFCERYPKRQGAPAEPDEAEKHRDRIGRLLAHLERTQWRDIEEAPKNGTEIDVWKQCYQDGEPTNGYRYTDASFEDGKWCDCDGDPLEWKDSIGQEARVTHFMPLPPSPETPR